MPGSCTDCIRASGFATFTTAVEREVELAKLGGLCGVPLGPNRAMHGWQANKRALLALAGLGYVELSAGCPLTTSLSPNTFAAMHPSDFACWREGVGGRGDTCAF